MQSNPNRRAATVALLAALAGCATKPKYSGKPVVSTIALIPATDPRTLTLENQNGVQFLIGIAQLAYLLDSKAKAKLFNERMASRRRSLAPQLTAIVVDALRAAGYPVEVLDKLERDPEDPDDIDYEKIKTDADAIVQLRINEIGMFSSKLSPDYLPRVNVDGKLYIRSRDDSVYDETLYYGVDAKEGKPWALVSDRRYTYASFDDVMGKVDELSVVFEEATIALSNLLAGQLREALAKQTQRGP